MKKKRFWGVLLAILLVVTAIPLTTYANSAQDSVPIESSAPAEDNVKEPPVEQDIPDAAPTDAEPSEAPAPSDTAPPSVSITPEADVPAALNAPAAANAALPRALDATLDEFNDAVEFRVDKVGDDRSGNTQTLKILYIYSDGTVSVAANDVEMRVSVPAGVLATWPSTSAVTYSSAPGPNGSTVVTLKWADFGAASGKDCELYFSVPNGVTPNGTQYEINTEVYYKNEKSVPNSKDINYTVLTDTFQWKNIAHSPASRNTNLAAGSYDIPDITISYDTAIDAARATGVAYTDEITINDKVTVGEDALILPQNIVLSPANGTLTYNTKNVGGIDYVSDFTIEYKLKNSDTSSELSYTAPTVTVKNAKVSSEVASTKTVSVLTSSAGDLRGGAYPAVAVDGSLPHIQQDGGGNQYQALAGTNGLNITARYTQPADDTPTLSENISKAVQSVNGNSSTERKAFVNAGDTVVYQVYGFANRQQGAMTSYKVADTFSTAFYPTKMTTGSYSTYSPLTSYRINVYTASSGGSPAAYKDVQFGTNSVVTFADLGVNPSEITKVEFDYGAVPSGFTPYNVPTFTCKVKEQTSEPYQNIVNSARVDYTYNGGNYGKDASTSQEYKVRTPGTEVESFNKSLKNLTNPSSKVPAAGDLVEYTITFTNETGIDLVNPEVEDHYTNQAPYLTPVLDGYIGKNVKVVSAPDGVAFSDAVIRNQGASDEYMFITMSGKIKNSETIKLSYVMKVSDTLQKGEMVNNSFDAYGWPEGPGHQRIYIGSGYNTAKSSGQLAVPQAVIYQQLTRDQTSSPVATTADAVAKDETITVKLRVENDDYLNNAQSDVLHLKNIVSSLRSTNAFELVTTTPCTLNYTSNGTPGTTALTPYTGTNLSSSYMNLGFTMPNITDESIVLYPGDYAEVTFQIRAIRHANVSGSPSSIIRTESFSIYAYGLFAETEAEYGNSLGSVYKDTSDLDRNPASNSYIYTSQSLWLLRENKLYGGIQPAVSPQTLNLANATTRTYSFRVYNYSDVGLDMVLNSVVTKLPLYESYVSGSAQAAYNSTGGLGAIDAQENKVLADGRRVIEFTNFPTAANGKVSVDPEGGYLYITFRTEFTGSDLDAAIRKAASWTDNNFIPAVTLENNGEMGSYYYTITKADDTEDWDNDASTGFHYRANPMSVTNTYSAYTVPGITITPRKIVQSGSVELYQPVNTGDTFIPTNNIGWNVKVQNTSAAKAMEDPTVVLTLPYGMRFLEFEGGAQPAYITNIQETMVNNRQVLTLTLDHSFLNGSVDFNIKTSAIDCPYGNQTAHAYLAPNQQEIFYTSSAGTKDTANLQALTGLTNDGYDKDWNAVHDSDVVQIFGTFAFDASISITGDAQTTSNGGYITVPRTLNSFSYTLEFQNASINKDYESIAVIDRMPGVGDLNNSNPTERGSTLEIDILSAPVVMVDGVPLGAGDYELDYTNAPKNTVFTKGDYGLTGTAAASWTSGMALDEATAFRVQLANPLTSGQKLTITFDAKFEGNESDFPLKSAAGYDSFGVGFLAKADPSADFSEIIAEPPAVGITFDDLYAADVSGHLFIDRNGNGVMDQDDEYFAPATQVVLKDGTSSRVGAPYTTSVNSNDGNSGYYEFRGLPCGEQYAVSFTIPEKYRLAGVTPLTRSAVTNSFTENNGEAVVQFAAADGEDQSFTFHAALIPTQGRIDGMVFIDNNGNGMYDEGDKLFDTPVDVTLVSDGREPVKSTTDAATGRYVFDYLDFADYKVQVSVPEGYVKSSGTADFTGTTGTIETQLLTLDAATPEYTKNAGLVTADSTVPPADPANADPADTGTSGTVKTGDDAFLFGWIIAAAAGVTVLILVALYVRRRKTDVK